MKPLLKSILLSTCLCVCIATKLLLAQSTEKPKQPDHILSVSCDYVEGTYMGLGTGVVIRDDIVVTNYHVIHDMKNTNKPTDDVSADFIMVEDADGNVASAKVIIDDWLFDIAVLKINAKCGKPIKGIVVPKENIVVKIQGTKGGTNYDEAKGILVEKHGPGHSGHGWFAVAGARARKGDSGGAVINEDGDLVGLIRAINTKDEPPATFCVDALYIKAILEKADAK